MKMETQEMNVELQKVKKKFPSKKLLLGSIIGILAIVAIVAAVAIYYHTVNVDATVSEAFSSTTVDLDFSGYPGETIVKEINIDNAANVGLDTEFIWNEDTNVNGVVYTTDMPKILTLPSGANIVEVQFVYDPTSPIGDVTGTITLNRV